MSSPFTPNVNSPLAVHYFKNVVSMSDLTKIEERIDRLCSTSVKSGLCASSPGEMYSAFCAPKRIASDN